MSQDIDFKNIIPQLKDSVQKVTRYAALLFFCLVAGIYIFMLYRINALAGAQPDPNTAQASTQKLLVNKDVAAQLLKLEDNSVNVQTVFQEARDNPFEE